MDTSRGSGERAAGRGVSGRVKPGLRKGDLRQLLRLVVEKRERWTDILENQTSQQALVKGRCCRVALSSEEIARKAPWAQHCRKQIAVLEDLARRIDVELRS